MDRKVLNIMNDGVGMTDDHVQDKSIVIKLPNHGESCYATEEEEEEEEETLFDPKSANVQCITVS